MRPEELAVIIDSLKQDINPEGPHLELKRKWGDFSNQKYKEEFIKDLAALANTYGDGDRYLIVGLSGSKLFNEPLPEDESNIQQMVSGNLDPPFRFEIAQHEIEEKFVSVITVFKSSNRPHVVKEFKKRKNCIFVRRGSTIAYANRSELDEIYSERYEKRESDLHCEIISDWASYADHRARNYSISGIVLEVEIFNKGDKRTTIRSVRAFIGDEVEVGDLIVEGPAGQIMKLTFSLDSGEGHRFKIYLPLNKLIPKTLALGSRKIILNILDIYDNTISAEKTIDIR